MTTLEYMLSRATTHAAYSEWQLQQQRLRDPQGTQRVLRYNHRQVENETNVLDIENTSVYINRTTLFNIQVVTYT